MAKKKGKGGAKGNKKDVRGYGQSSVPKKSTSSAAPSEALLEQIKDDFILPENCAQSTKSSTTVQTTVQASDRFTSKLGAIVDRLEGVKFSNEQIDRVVSALGYNVTFESALDWLCLHCSSEELPGLFTDTRIVQQQSKSSSSSVTVLKLVKPTPTVPEKSSTPSLLSATHTSNKEAENKKRTKEQEQEAHRQAAERKALLLKQYQYENNEEEEAGKQEDANAATSDAEVANRSPEELELMKQERELKELEDDVGNEANNYMRSKQEIQQLKKQVKQKRQVVQGLQRRIERQQRQKEKTIEKEITVEDKDSEMIEESMGMDLFGDNEDEDANESGGAGIFEQIEEVPEEPKVASTPSRERISCIIPSNWTGNTPIKALEERCRKQKQLKLKYTKLGPPEQDRGYKLTISSLKSSENTTYEAFEYDFLDGSLLREYLALQALYEMDPTLSLHHIFPPDFSKLWLAWKDEIKQAQTKERQIQQEARQERLDYLLSLVQQPKKGDVYDEGRNEQQQPLVEPSATSNGEGNETKDEQYGDNWDDPGESWEDKEDIIETTEAGVRLQKMFQSRQATGDYENMHQLRQALPMSSYREQVLNTVRENSVTILCAETGAGKTTQCPQYLIEEALLQGQGDKRSILVTQPRRIAATSVAERVSEEMCEDRLGRLVGYQIRMEAKRSSETKLLFCTTGIVLRRLQEDQTLSGVTHVIVDEVHERQQQTDVLLVALRRLLGSSRPDLKVILMSATLDSELFCSFFHGAPLISVPGRTFPVSSYYLEDLFEATGHVIENGSRHAIRETNHSGNTTTLWVTTRGGEKRKEDVDVSTPDDEVSGLYAGYTMATQRSMDRVKEDIINYDLIEDVLLLLFCRPEQNTILLAPDGRDCQKGSILVFLPGLGEIRALTDQLESNRQLSNKFEIIPMHSTLSSKDQKRAFLPTKLQKLILSTNIAETSVTISDVVCVIDAGRVREVRRNKRTSTAELITDWCSKASAKQRAGRAGRVQAGLCLKLYSSRTAQQVMKTTSEPELRRVPLEEICLSILASGLASNCSEFLSQAPQPPMDGAVEAARDVLCTVGAIEKRENIDSTQVDHLTPLGRHLAKLPVDVRLGKMLIFGSMFRCVDKVLTIAAALSSKSPFPTFVSDRGVATAKQKSFADPDSDFLTYVNVWEAFAAASEESKRDGRKFCQINYLNYTALLEIADARSQFVDLLCSIGFLDRRVLGGKGNNRRLDYSSIKNSSFSENDSNIDLVHAVVCAGLFPNIGHLKPSTPGHYELYHKKERLFFHKSSGNASKQRFPEAWVGFHEKFGTSNRVSVATTCFVHPFSLLLFGGSVQVKHLDRLVVIDDWMHLRMAPQIGVILKDLRRQLDVVLEKMFEKTHGETLNSNMVTAIVNLLAS